MYNLENSNKKQVRPFPPIPCITEFPFLDYTFDKVTDWEVQQALGQKINEVINFINNTLETTVLNEIDKFFTDKMINTFYNAETETLILTINKEV